MIDFILWVLVGAAVINTLLSARYYKPAMRAIKVTLGIGAAIYLVIAGFAIMGLWVWLAFATGQIQFALIAGIPWLVNTAAGVADR